MRLFYKITNKETLKLADHKNTRQPRLLQSDRNILISLYDQTAIELYNIEDNLWILYGFVNTIIGIVLLENYVFNDAKLILLFAFFDFAVVQLNILSVVL